MITMCIERLSGKILTILFTLYFILFKNILTRKRKNL